MKTCKTIKTTNNLIQINIMINHQCQHLQFHLAIMMGNSTWCPIMIINNHQNIGKINTQKTLNIIRWINTMERCHSIRWTLTFQMKNINSRAMIPKTKWFMCNRRLVHLEGIICILVIMAILWIVVIWWIWSSSILAHHSTLIITKLRINKKMRLMLKVLKESIINFRRWRMKLIKYIFLVPRILNLHR